MGSNPGLYEHENFMPILVICGAHGSVSVAALCCKPDGRGFETNELNDFFFFNLPTPSIRTTPRGLLSL
jgi:hypothetical protein